MKATFLSRAAIASLAGAILIAVVIWLFSPLLGESFENGLLRSLLAAVPILVWLLVFLLIGWRRSKRDGALVEEVAKAPRVEQDSRLAEEEEAQRRKLAEALAALKRSTEGKGGALYQLPWYVIIGPPGAGKTTALLNSGLEFPLAEGRVAGVGGTRACDWWLSERAVLIDTAGRYTTQDSEAAVDKAGWESFLDLLRRARPRLPLNGVLVAIGTDLLGKLDEAGREAHAAAVRRRVKELENRLGLRLPVYLLVTKADLMAGFVEFFDDLDRGAREQVWGFTFDPKEGDAQAGTVPNFAKRFAELQARLSSRLIERLQAERGASQRALIAGFPAQLAALEGPLESFARAAFGGSRLDPAPMLRGVYFTSGTQEGTPLDRLAGALARSFGLDPRRPAAVMGQKGRSYFLGRLLKDVVFNEARLAAREGNAVKRGRLVQAAAWGVALLAVIGGGAYAWNANRTEAERADRVAVATERAESAVATAGPLDRVSDPDLARTLGYLEANRALPEAAAGEGPGLGLSREEDLGAATEGAYRRALGRVLLPRLLARVEAQIRSALQRPDTLYEATRVYLMLGRQGPLDKGLIREWFAVDWAQAYPGAVNQPGREALARHLDALLEQDLPSYPIDGALVDEARRVFSRMPMAGRVYARLRPLGANLPPWRPSEVLGQAGSRHFARASGQPLTEGVPGLFTVEGLYRVVLPRLPQAALEAASEYWVLGPNAASQAGDPRKLEEDVLALYATEYARAWQTLLDDLVLPPPSGLPEAAEKLNLLGAPNSPMKDLLRGIARQLSPGTAPELPAGGAGAAAAAAVATQAAQTTAGRVAAALGATASTGAEPVARVVEARFKDLREAAGAPLDSVLVILNELYVQVARLATAPPGTVLPPSPGLDPGQKLLAEAARQPPPLSNWLRALAQSTQQARAGGAKAAIAAAGAQQLGPLCRGLETRFPFRRALTAADMPLDDFVRLFAPGGLLDQFFTTNIRPHADTTQNPWRPVASDGLEPAVSQADLIQFQRAQAIRDAFFPSGVPGVGLGLRWRLTFQGLPAGTTTAKLDNEGMAVELPAQSARPIEMSWPSRAPVSISFDPPAAFQPAPQEGPWAALRFAMLGRLVATSAPDRFRLSVPTAGGADFLLQAGSGVNPFNLRELSEFRCPALPAPKP
ncbi:type VI secretion system membrane subunit TssM [Roseomonas chloroacetimidivorans]|uniref:type VI secretion system membrane subunit TssM n=1 Tax=Roseomonas chloroacetimidivorans TaxID=1766656 RepID=UPI003C70FF1C